MRVRPVQIEVEPSIGHGSGAPPASSRLAANANRIAIRVLILGHPQPPCNPAGTRVGSKVPDSIERKLTAGLATSAAAAGVSERAITNQTGHPSTTMMRRYIRDGSLFSEDAAAGVGQ